MDIRSKNLVNFSSGSIKTNNKLKSNQNMSFAGVALKELPSTPIIKQDELLKYAKAAQDGINNGYKEVIKSTENDRLNSKAASTFYKGLLFPFKHIFSPLAEKYYVKPHLRDHKELKKLRTAQSIVNLVGNSAKELTCMIFYPLMTLTNQDMSNDKKRFVGIYDFFVTCFSLSGALAFALMKPQTDYLMNKTVARYEKQGFKNLAKAQKGAGFVFNIALQTLLCKRILAPAFSPPLAAGVRKRMEQNDAKKAATAGAVVKPQTDKKDEKTAATKPVEKPAAKAETKTAAKSVEKSAAKTEPKPSVKPADKPAEKIAEKPVNQPAVNAEEKQVDKPATKPQPEQNLFTVYKKSTQKPEKTA